MVAVFDVVHMSLEVINDLSQISVYFRPLLVGSIERFVPLDVVVPGMELYLFHCVERPNQRVANILVLGE